MLATAKTYEILDTLARGGMGEVMVARERAGAVFERLVVLKAALPHLADDDEFVTAFLDEARLASQLQHPNVAQIHDVAAIDGRPCIVMEWLRGSDVGRILRDLVRAGRPMDARVAAAILLGAASGLAHAHRATDSRGRPLGIVHRDVSPQNVFVTADGMVKVIDFGIALSRQKSTRTLTGVLKGKVGYMAPEQLRGKGVDARSDVWSLGVVAWECLMGRRLFKARGTTDGVPMVLKQPIPRPSEHRPDVDAALDAVVMGMLERDPRKRTQTCDDVVEAVVAWGRSHRLPAARELGEWLADVCPPAEAPAAPAEGAPTTTVRLEPAPPSPASGGTAWMPGAAGATAGGGAAPGTTAVARPDGSGPPRTATVGVPGGEPADDPVTLPELFAGPAPGDEASTASLPGDDGPEPVAARPTPLPTEGDRPRRLWPWALGAGALGLVVLVSVGVGLLASGGEGAAEARPPAEPVGEPPAGGSPEPTEADGVAEAEEVTIAVEGIPEGAELWLDGERRSAPEVVAPAVEGTRHLEVRGPDGRAMFEQEVIGDQNVTVAYVPGPPDGPGLHAGGRPPGEREPPRMRQAPRMTGSGSSGGLVQGIDRTWPE